MNLTRLGAALGVTIAAALTAAAPPAFAAPASADLDFSAAPPYTGWELRHENPAEPVVKDGMINLDERTQLTIAAGSPWLSVSNARGWAVHTKLRVDPATPNAPACAKELVGHGGQVGLVASDGAAPTILGLNKDLICLKTVDRVINLPMNTTDRVHSYRVEGKGTQLRLLVDGREVAAVKDWSCQVQGQKCEPAPMVMLGTGDLTKAQVDHLGFTAG
ncbi:hypothetical protein NLX83_00055 [Allokutzneria sp. A3M-2-11 16]|uniref:hypothetical protein n=1 Tax=Allokutzneria sp. A3M-2-11 16 TaxID=2962043 RepID=UPI0020B6790F|nr:hypothetical protein [Allokutzneria sp. A3M-2-11 16]MCP3797639.1 hypothetical protein [Allokutzneria sp. A3M-2-11 16]